MNCLVLIIVALLGLLGLLGRAAPRQYALKELLPVARIHGLSFSHDESEILFLLDSGTGFKMRSISIRNERVTPITTLQAEPVYAASYFPRDKRVLFIRDTKDRRRELCVRELDGRERDVAPDARVASFGGWAADGQGFYALTKIPSTLRRIDASSYESNILFRGEFHGYFRQISPDEQWVGLGYDHSGVSRGISLMHVGSKESQNLAVQIQAARYGIAGFDPDSRFVYYLTDEGKDFLRVRRYGLASKTHEEVESADSDITGMSFSSRGKYRITVIDQDGRHFLRVYDTIGAKHLTLPDIPKGTISFLTMSGSENLMAFHLDTDVSASSLYCLDLRSLKLKRLTDMRQRKVKPEQLVESETVRFASLDGFTIPSLLYRPHQATAKHKAPALVWLHGGPATQMRVGYSPHLQYLVNHGFVILAVNYRGSTGYGASFSEAADKKHDREPVFDCIEAKKYLASLPFIDPARIGVLGESYGGYLVLASMAFYPDTFKTGVDIFGVSDWLRTMTEAATQMPLGRNPLLWEIGHPVKDREKLQAMSPLFHAEKIQRPLFVLQGARDPKISKADTDKLVDAVKASGVPVEYVVLEDEGHGLAAPRNYLQVWERILRFLQNHL
jgi:dipeptidyl aminopeptidase/acylaminoacyl peptidase